ALRLAPKEKQDTPRARCGASPLAHAAAQARRSLTILTGILAAMVHALWQQQTPTPIVGGKRPDASADASRYAAYARAEELSPSQRWWIMSPPGTPTRI